MILQGKTISPGIVHGHSRVVDAPTILANALNVPPADSAQHELERLSAAVGRASAQLDHLRRHLSGRVTASEVSIFAAHAGLLRDTKFLSQMEAEIMRHGRSAEGAVATVARGLYQTFKTSTITLAQDKATDILDIGRRLVQCLGDAAQTEDELEENVVIVAPSLTPTELVKYAHQGVIGFVTDTCGPKSHTAILARGFGLPLITLNQAGCEKIKNQAEIVLDGENGIIISDPAAEDRVQVNSILGRIRMVAPEAEPASLQTVTLDGVEIRVLINISDPSEADAVPQYGAAGVGLFRTEFLYMDRLWWPSEEESVEIYRDVVNRVQGGELNVRLVDFGAEKCPPYADFPINRNPSLGLRGIRLLLQREDILRSQVKVLAKIARERPLTVMLPMVDSLDTLEKTFDQLCRICACRTRDQLPFKVTTMIEVPAAALMIDALIPQVDGISIGLNDLTQYMLAADRDDEYVGAYHDALQPAVLRTVANLVQTAARHNKPATICGELAGDPHLTGLLLGMGTRQLSVSRTNYVQVARAIQKLKLSLETELANQVLKLNSGAAVRQFLSDLRTLKVGDQSTSR